MSSRNITNIPASVRVKLLNKARKNKRPFKEILQYFAMERFLYRLSISQHSHKFFLKGAFMFTAWNFNEHRATMDIDMLAKTSNDLENLVSIVQEICELRPDIDDGIIFDGQSVIGKESQVNREYAGIQLKFYGKLNNARFQMKLDIGFGDIIFPSPASIAYPTILEFPYPHLRGYTVETVIAEKFETIVSRGLDNSRMKDFYDIWTLLRQINFKKSDLFKSIRLTFSNRHTNLNKNSIQDLKLLGESELKEKQWKHFIRKGHFSFQIPSFKEIVNEISFLLSSFALEVNKEESLD